MMAERLFLTTRRDSAALGQRASEIESEVWSNLGFLNFTHAHQHHYENILERFAEFQLCLTDADSGQLVALANCAPIAWRLAEPLPDEGWDWLVQTAGSDDGRQANLLGALAISVPIVYRGRGYAQRMLAEMKLLASRSGFEALVAPVRPSAKYRFPTVGMSEYIRWSDAGGRCFDPWLRSHYAHGAELLRVCPRSMVVRQDVAFWRNWAGRELSGSGEHVVDGGLVPVRIDIDEDIGLYEEPNVWVSYAVH